jgi:uncharacterized Ntn-hydrolase superfamily protein
MTFTAVARCPRTGRLGVGMATRAPAVGNRCPIVRPGYGAASVQLIADPRQTMLCGRLLDLGYSEPRCWPSSRPATRISCDDRSGSRDSYGNTAAFSGPTSNGYSGHFMGRQWVAMGNAVVSEAVVKAMADSLAGSEDEELWERLMCAVEAGGKAGGKAEGQRSAALLVFGAEPFALVDLRVDFHPEPIGELRRIYDWFRPLLPYYQERVLDPYIIRGCGAKAR